MATVKKLDSKRRAVFPEQFQPGDAFLEEVRNGRIVYQLIPSEEVPVAEVERRDGRLFVNRPLDRAAIARAVREERDSR